MKITIFAATGGVGAHVLRQAVAAGHEVTAVVRNPGRLALPVRYVQADLASPDPSVLQSAVAGADAVISGLGQRTLTDVGITASGTAAIVLAMKATQARRLVVISASPISTVPSPGRPNPPKRDPGDGLLIQYVLGPITKTVLRTPYRHLALMEDLIRDSGLDWTVVRPPRLTNKPLSGNYRTALDRNVGSSVSRADVAELMLRVLGQPETIGHAVGVAA